jgi:hypothetical protein
MPNDEREEEVARREAEHALRDDRKQAPPVNDRPVDEPVERRHADLEQTPAPTGE